MNSNTESFKLVILGNHSKTDCSLKNNPLKGKPTGPDPAPLPNSSLLPPPPSSPPPFQTPFDSYSPLRMWG